MSPTFRALRNPNYRRYLAGSVVSNTGTWMQRVAQDWLVLQLPGNGGTALGLQPKPESQGGGDSLLFRIPLGPATPA